MITVPAGVRIYLACGVTARGPEAEPVCRPSLRLLAGARGDLIKVLYWDKQGFCLFAKRLEKGRFVWPAAKEGALTLTPAQMSMLLEGIDWRAPQTTWAPQAAG